MEVEQQKWGDGWQRVAGTLSGPAQLVLLFGSGPSIDDARAFDALRATYPGSKIVGCSTAGEICADEVLDGALVATALRMERARVRVASVALDTALDSRAAGERVARALPPEELRHVLVFSEGLHVNGTALTEGLRAGLPPGVAVTGGLSADQDRFVRTAVFADAPARSNVVVAVGFYGAALHVGYGSLGGWDPFGPERLITRSTCNVLYELDDQPALDLYEKYLGEHAAGLPATGLLFPLSLRTRPGEPRLVRTILGIDRKERSLTFAGDVPEGELAQLMRANFDRLIDGAHGAAERSQDALGGSAPDLTLLVSCVGRKLVLKQRVDEELESVRDVVGGRTTLAGFYSYGEICPSAPGASCDLHNQTMTVTTLREALE